MALGPRSPQRDRRVHPRPDYKVIGGSGKLGYGSAGADRLTSESEGGGAPNVSEERPFLVARLSLYCDR
jgi:hypothetical protein